MRSLINNLDIPAFSTVEELFTQDKGTLNRTFWKGGRAVFFFKKNPFLNNASLFPTEKLIILTTINPERSQQQRVCEVSTVGKISEHEVPDSIPGLVKG